MQLAVGRRLEVVGAQGAADVGEVGPQDAVVVEADHVVEGRGELLLDDLDPRGTRLGVAGQVALARVEAGLEEVDEQPGDVDVAAERALDVVEREGRVALLHVLRVGAQHGRLAPRQPGAEHQRVEAVGLVVAVPDRAQRVGEELAGGVGQLAAVAQAELVDVGLAAEAGELVGPLVDDLDAHRGEHRQHLAERQRCADAEHLQAGLAATGVDLLEEREVDALVALDGLQPTEVGGTDARVEVLLVGLRERLGPRARQARAPLLAVLRDDGVGEVVAPRARRLDHASLEVGDVEVGDRLALGRVDDEVDAARSWPR